MASLIHSLRIASNDFSTDLLEGSTGFKLRLDGWSPQVATKDGNEYQDVVETITLKAIGTSLTNLSERITNYLDKTIYRIKDRLNDPVAPDLVYLFWAWTNSLDNERRAVLKDMSYSINTSPYFPPTYPNHQMLNVTLTLLRAPYWETVVARNVQALTLLTGGDSKEVTLQTQTGSVPSRLGAFWVEGTGLNEMWSGFRTSKYGDKDNFKPVWPFDNVTTFNDATDSGGTVTWTSGDTSMLERLRIKMTQVSSITSRTSQRGTFMVLLRARSSGTETFNARLSEGFTYGGHWNTHSRVKISGTDFLFYPMGSITIPPLSLRFSGGVNAILADFALRLEVEVNTAGTGSFEATRFVLIPQNEGYIHIKGVNTSGVLAYMRAYQDPDEKWTAFTYWPTIEQTETPEEFDVFDYHLPFDTCNVVFAGQSDSQSLTSTIDWYAEQYARYLGVGETVG